MKLIALTGMPGSGKGLFVEMARARGMPVIRMGDLVWDVVEKEGLELNAENVGNVAMDERKKFKAWLYGRSIPLDEFTEAAIEAREKEGYGIWAERTITKLKEFENSSLIVVDGVRGDREMKKFRNRFGTDLIVIAVHASLKVRFERIRIRKRQDDISTIEGFDKRNARELDWGVGNVIAMADYMIINEGTKEDFEREINKLLDEFMTMAE